MSTTLDTAAAPVIVLFRDDLRVADHPALTAAARTGAPIVPLYAVDPAHGLGEGPSARPLGGAVRWWLHHSLDRLGEALAALGSPLVLRGGRPAEVVPALVRETGARRVFVNRSVVPAHAEGERALGAALEPLGATLELADADALVHPNRLRTRAGGPYHVYTPFWKALKDMVGQPAPLPAPCRLTGPATPPPSEPLERFRLTPGTPDWAGGLRETWSPGEAGAWARLNDFLGGAVDRYRHARNLPAEPGTSRLSPHLRFGEITPRQVWRAVLDAAGPGPGTTTFLGELGWREFNRYQLFHNPLLHEKPLRAEFEHFPWRHAEDDLAAWRAGRTGFPIVDAGMRELWHTGWMHNRVRMIVGSFLVKDLLVPWQDGERWFWDTLVDADWGSNPGNWQWVAGCGADAAPFFRVFNPVLQGEKFDPRGDYVKRWVPELRDIDRRIIHKPWEAPLEAASAGYPEPCVDHGAARHRALAAWRSIKDAAE